MTYKNIVFGEFIVCDTCNNTAGFYSTDRKRIWNNAVGRGWTSNGRKHSCDICNQQSQQGENQ